MTVLQQSNYLLLLVEGLTSRMQIASASLSIHSRSKVIVTLGTSYIQTTKTSYAFKCIKLDHSIPGR